MNIIASDGAVEVSGYAGDARRGPPLPSPSQAMRPALKLLVQSYEYALTLDRTGWDFAVEIGSLRCRHLNNNDFRWLVCKGYVQHACEISLADEAGRRFSFEGELRFSPRSCFVLTPAGATFAQQVLNPPQAESGSDRTPARLAPGKCAGTAVPAWHAQRRELRMGDALVKRFRVPAAIQERILSAFQEEDWPERIDDPLPPIAGMDPKRRLHAAIHSLNRNQKNPLIHFCGDGNGCGLFWKSICGGIATRAHRHQ